MDYNSWYVHFKPKNVKLETLQNPYGKSRMPTYGPEI